jgi:hypothetical protein
MQFDTQKTTIENFEGAEETVDIEVTVQMMDLLPIRLVQGVFAL